MPGAGRYVKILGGYSRFEGFISRLRIPGRFVEPVSTSEYGACLRYVKERKNGDSIVTLWNIREKAVVKRTTKKNSLIDDNSIMMTVTTETDKNNNVLTRLEETFNTETKDPIHSIFDDFTTTPPTRKLTSYYRDENGVLKHRSVLTQNGKDTGSCFTKPDGKRYGCTSSGSPKQSHRRYTI